MVFRKLILILFVFPLLPAFSQSDSLTIKHARWHTTKVGRGIKLKVCALKIFNSNQQISILEVKPSAVARLDLGFEKKNLKPTSEYGRQAGAAAAINGTFFDVKNGGSVNYIRSDGKMITANRLGTKGRNMTQTAAVVFRKGTVTIEQWDGSVNWEQKLPGEDVMVTGPALITKNTRALLDSTAFVNTRHPRSAVALKRKKVYLVAVDGRNNLAAGMSLFELASFFKWMKTDYAVNLDGGGSTCLWVKDFSEDGIVNFPSDNKKWDHAGERKVANVIMVYSHSTSRH